MNKILSDKLPDIKELCITHNVKTLFAFGSVCNDRFNNQSDIDLLVSFNIRDFGDYADNYFELADKLEDLLHTNVDLITDKSLSNPYFIDSINKNKVLIYG